MNLTEQWQDVPFLNGYQASTWGRVRTRVKTEFRMIPRKRGNGEKKVRVGFDSGAWEVLTAFESDAKDVQYLWCWNGFKMRKFTIGALVCSTLVGKRPYYVAFHKDGDFRNHRPENLEWKLGSEVSKITLNRNRKFKLSDAQVEDVRKRIIAGERVTDLAKSFGVSKSMVCHIKSGRNRSQLGGK